ncbi:DUF983 domain-containing protein [Adhaeribacter sp. BT258]|uniref:DUF983 domain-containing protein n=1 Tax=Adhaeribacter terrigena TaxID=2793070 RepID=A0ABS1BZ23_9BACT|nr:DUF983 domain-containing protein [Adhaeribacter terrigena]MBK0402171.1 DUF983 domain-containing protein [Adhaeribacter terrigena]
MSQSKSLLSAILHTKCPRCREGNMFPKGTLYTTSFADMHSNCANCGQTFEPEPGYYFGAMYVSFAFNVAVFLAAMVVLYQFLEDVSTTLMLGVLLVTIIGFLPVIFRLSRALWISIFVHYEGPSGEIPKKA